LADAPDLQEQWQRGAHVRHSRLTVVDHQQTARRFEVHLRGPLQIVVGLCLIGQLGKEPGGLGGLSGGKEAMRLDQPGKQSRAQCAARAKERGAEPHGAAAAEGATGSKTHGVIS